MSQFDFDNLDTTAAVGAQTLRRKRANPQISKRGNGDSDVSGVGAVSAGGRERVPVRRTSDGKEYNPESQDQANEGGALSCETRICARQNAASTLACFAL